jgi:hypothetical protein
MSRNAIGFKSSSKVKGGILSFQGGRKYLKVSAQ